MTKEEKYEAQKERKDTSDTGNASGERKGFGEKEKQGETQKRKNNAGLRGKAKHEAGAALFHAIGYSSPVRVITSEIQWTFSQFKVVPSVIRVP